jgi:hypothetical protein
MARKGKKPHSRQVEKNRKQIKKLGTKGDEFGVQGSTRGAVDPAYGKYRQSGVKTGKFHR